MQQQMFGGMPMNLQNMNAVQFQQMRQNGMQPRMPGHMPQAHLAQGGQHPNPVRINRPYNNPVNTSSLISLFTPCLDHTTDSRTL